MKADIVPLSSLETDAKNANRGTERGRYALERSLEKLGAGRSILLDKNGKIIAGNKTAETAGEMGIEDVVIVRTTGDKLVAVMREDLDLDEVNGRARELAYADNRVGQLDLEFDPAVIVFDLEAGLDLSDWWQPGELQGILETAANSIVAPEDFKEYDEGIDTEYCCPKCGYKWSGKPS